MLDAFLLGAAELAAAWTLILLVAGRHGPGGRAARIAFGLGGLPGLTALLLAISQDPLPALVAAGCGLLVSVALPSRWRPAGALFFGQLLVVSAVYVLYLTNATLVFGESLVPLALGLFLLVLECAALCLILASGFEMIDALFSATLTEAAPPAPVRWPVVCLQVPAHNEPPELLIETIRSLVAIDYPALRIQVIDNNTPYKGLWGPVEAVCEDLRAEGHLVDFVHLPSWPGYKAGALNWGRDHLADDVEIIGIVDADYVVDSTFLRATIPHFSDPAVAFVQTPQDYREWQDSGFYTACYVGFDYFFKVGMVSRAHRNSIIFAGTMGLIRRSVLDAIGGWDEKIITEDAEASLRILATGARSVFVPTAFGRGIMPLTYEGLRGQRFRWAFGGIQILRRHWRLLLTRSSSSQLTLGQRYDYLVGGLWWFNDALTLGFTLFVFAGALGILAGRSFVLQRLSAVGVVLPIVFIGLNLMRYVWAMRTSSGVGIRLGLAALRVNLSLSWVIAQACVRGLVEERGVFLRTPKFQGTPAAQSIRMVGAETGLAVAGFVLALGTLAVAGYSIVGLIVVTLLAWSMVIYGSATGFALGDPTRAPMSAALGQKAVLELVPRVGRVLTARRTRIGVMAALGLAIALLSLGLATESVSPQQASLPGFPGPLVGPLRPPGLPSPTLQPASATPTPPKSTPIGSHVPGQATSAPAGSSAPGPSPGGSPRPSPSPAQGPSPTPKPSPTPSPTPAPTASPGHPTPPPHPTPQPRPSR